MTSPTRSTLDFRWLVKSLLLLAWSISATAAHADAIMRTRAMSATTIVELFVEEGRVVAEVEIGGPDLAAFANMLPDEIYARLGHEPVPLRERYRRFFEEDVVVVADDGGPLPALVEAMEPRTRIRRDEITGLPLPVSDEEAETVLFARFAYPFTAPRPKTVSIGGRIPAGAGQVGFVLYHEGVAVNDFRYLTASQTVELDWDDPWYSTFGVRALRRTYFAPMNGFLYVEPYEVRKEIIVRPKDLQRWVDLGLAGRETIPAEMQVEMLRQIAEFLRPRQPVLIDGAVVPPDLARVNFLERTLTSSTVIDPPRDLDLDGAVIGVIFVYPTDGLPQNVTMTWDLFDERIQLVPASAVDQAGPLPTLLEPDFAVLEWQNFLKHPDLPTLTVLTPPPSGLQRAASWAWWLGLVATIGLAARLVGGWRRGVGPAPAAAAIVVVAVGATAGLYALGQHGRMSDERSHEVVSGILHNIYRAFDFRDEEQIYDVLDVSIEGDMLADVYLETRRGLELQSQGGARAKVKEIELVELATESTDAGGFLAIAAWEVGASVGHWGHVHQRRNRYRAELAIRPVDGAWKLAGLEILEEECL